MFVHHIETLEVTLTKKLVHVASNHQTATQHYSKKKDNMEISINFGLETTSYSWNKKLLNFEFF